MKDVIRVHHDLADSSTDNSKTDFRVGQATTFYMRREAKHNFIVLNISSS